MHRDRNEYRLVQAIFLRCLGCVYVIAFLSLWVQIHGLIGSQGILPIADYLQRAEVALGDSAWHRLPTLCWWDPGDFFLHVQCVVGVFFGICLFVGVGPLIASGCLWLLYLSLLTAGQTFLSFQWDILLLETGFLAILWSPATIRPRWVWEVAGSSVVVWLLRWLQFRLIFSSGVVKLISGDPTWSELRALDFHFETQPLPHWASWYVHQLPDWCHAVGVLATFAIELAVPFAIFFGRRARVGAAVALAAFQIVIAATGNYGYFNLLSLMLCLPLLDDQIFQKLLHRLTNRVAISSLFVRSEVPGSRWGCWVCAPIIALVLMFSCMQFGATLRLPIPWPQFTVDVHRLLRPLHISSGYGLFAVMTTDRPEIIVESSENGREWQPYEFRWKPGDVARAPGFVAPHMPRLDWQMWFASLRSYSGSPWMATFLTRLLLASPDVVSLLQISPKTPPRYVRAVLYDYQFTDWKTRNATGHWWTRAARGDYSPVLSLKKR